MEKLELILIIVRVILEILKHFRPMLQPDQMTALDEATELLKFTEDAETNQPTNEDMDAALNRAKAALERMKATP